jgi:hypothetical protein
MLYVAGYPAIMGLQPLYFKDAELGRQGQLPELLASREVKHLERPFEAQGYWRLAVSKVRGTAETLGVLQR